MAEQIRTRFKSVRLHNHWPCTVCGGQTSGVNVLTNPAVPCFDFSFAYRPKKADVRGRNFPGSYRLCPLHSWRSNSAETDR